MIWHVSTGSRIKCDRWRTFPSLAAHFVASGRNDEANCTRSALSTGAPDLSGIADCDSFINPGCKVALYVCVDISTGPAGWVIQFDEGRKPFGAILNGKLVKWIRALCCVIALLVLEVVNANT